MTTKKTNRIAEGEVRCSLCGGDFPILPSRDVEGCSSCPVGEAFAPAHFSSDSCRSGGPRQHANCVGHHSHCTCDRCF